jgi:hypothetical protein
MDGASADAYAPWRAPPWCRGMFSKCLVGGRMMWAPCTVRWRSRWRSRPPEPITRFKAITDAMAAPASHISGQGWDGKCRDEARGADR